MKINKVKRERFDFVIVDGKRTIIFAVVVLFVFSAISSRLWYLQVVQHDVLSGEAENNRYRRSYKPSLRGNIYDSYGQLVLGNRPFFDLVIIPQFIRDRKDVILKRISEEFYIKESALRERLEEASKGAPSYQSVRIKRNISLDEVAKVESLKFFIPGLDVETVPRRAYTPETPAHLIGHLGEIDQIELRERTSRLDYRYRLGSLVGKIGIEKKYESFLHGTDGEEMLQVDVRGRLVSSETKVISSSRQGNDVYLTIDKDLQDVASYAFRGKNGAVVAMDPNTGAILAYVSHPNYDLSIYQGGLSNEDWQSLRDDPFNPLLDKVTGAVHPPGSVYKVITAIAALEEGIVTPQEKIFCGGKFSLGRADFGCWNKSGHGPLNLVEALERSCNVYFFVAAHKMGIEKLAKWAGKLGLGTRNGLDLNHENPGVNPNPDWKQVNKSAPWTSGDTVNLSIGQGFNQTNPLQIARLFAVIGNGGYMVKPYLLKKIESPAGEILLESEVQREKLDISETTLAVVREGLRRVIQGSFGTARNTASIKGFTVSGKTGTAQAVSDSRRSGDVAFNRRNHAWFAGYSPSENPEIVVVVLSEYDGGSGGGSAAPVAKEIIEMYWKKKFPEKFPKEEMQLLAERKFQIETPVNAETLPAVEQELPIGD